MPDEVDYLFRKTDTDHSNTIDLQELKTLLLEHSIKLSSQFEEVPAFEPSPTGDESFIRISIDKSHKIKACFMKLRQLLVESERTLREVFEAFDEKDTDSLSPAEFREMIR